MIIKFEKFEDGPEIGDYVVCNLEIIEIDLSYDLIKVIDYVLNNVGILKNITNEDKNNYKVYYNFPYKLIKPFLDNINDESEDKVKIFNLNKKQILFFSKNKEECELFLKSKKYNL